MRNYNRRKVDRGAFVAATALSAVLLLMPEMAMAADDAFLEIYDKMNGWVGGSAGKLLTFSSIVMSAVMGVAGFPAKYILGALGLGLLLGSADTIVQMIFG